jgi:citrate lyase subunit beta/citryl-CoA lyase
MRSLLYVPAHSERFLAKAGERGADVIILDLEDSVPEAEKDSARDGLARWVPKLGEQVFVRVNAGARQVEDALAALNAGAHGLVIPKAQDPRALDSLAGTLRGVDPRPMPFIALIEDPAAVLDARAIAKVPRVMGLALGSEDLVTALGAHATPDVLRFPKLSVHYAAKAGGKLSFGLLQSIADYADLDGLKAAADEARAHGFDGATCVHPSAVPILNAAFAPAEAERAWAKRVVDAAETHARPFELDGKMIDAPVIARARAILARAARSL